MPKIRCRGCEAALNIPDSAQGKVIACPKCGTKLKVPGGKGAASAKRPPARKKKASARADEGDPFSRLDLDDLEAEDEQICPYCAAEMDEDEVVCAKCGMNVETGKMDAREQKRRSRKGPDPAKFYGKAWSDSWEFVLKEKGLAIRTGIYWTLFATLHSLCAYMGFIYVQEQMPPKVFWLGMTTIMFLGIPGWYWVLSTRVVGATVLREEVRGDRLQFDFFTSIAAGVRAVFWPLIVMGPVLPLLWLVVMVSAFTMNPLVIGAVSLVLGFIPLLLLPIAMVHMTSKYTYKGWIFWELLKLLVKNFGPTLYMLVVAFVCLIPVAIVAVPILLVIKNPNPFASEVILGLNDKIALWVMGIADLGQDSESFSYMLVKIPLNILAAVLVLAPICFVAGFPTLFMMRANGLMGLYNQRTMDLVNRMQPGTPATFWVRYLAHVIDWLLTPLASFLVTASGRALSLAWGINGIGVVILLFSRPMFVPVFLPIWTIYMSWMYWVVQEASELKTTIGKDAFGLMVVTEDDKQMDMKQGTMKWFLRLVLDAISVLYLLAAFHPEKKTLHDIVSKSKVVWKGDR